MILTLNESSAVRNMLEILFPPKLPIFNSEDLSATAEYQNRMTRNPSRTHVAGGPASVIHVGTAREKRILLLPGRTI